MIHTAEKVPFNKPYFPAEFQSYISRVILNGTSQGDGQLSRNCTEIISKLSGGGKVLLTPSCTHALEMATLLCDLKPGDEVILPSFTFTSAAVALSNYGIVPVFVDINSRTKNLNSDKLKEALSSKTKAVSVVNYAGVAADYPVIKQFADENELKLIEDNAHGFLGSAFSKPLGSFGTVSTLSFHESKNFQCGEGGALIINDEEMVERAEILREKGTNRSRFLRGQVDKYTWVDLGSSQLMSEISAALLLPQLEMATTIHEQRLNNWNSLLIGIRDWAEANNFQLPFLDPDFAHTAHIFYVVAPSPQVREEFVSHLKELGIPALFHYQSLHSSPAGLKFGRRGNKNFEISEAVSSRLLRLPMYFEMTEDVLARIINGVNSFGVRVS